ncbi:MAG: 4-alpha-glucanotransferase [Rhodospirillales bacterium]|nr:4-alpha-glucanotransferase [Rhodospirillales bacterium]
MNPNLAALCAVNGVVWEYLDGAGKPKQAPEETCVALLQALGFDIAQDVDIDLHLMRLRNEAKNRLVPDTVIVNVGTEHRITGPFPEATEWHVQLEQGQSVEGTAQGADLILPPLPLGIHTLICAGQVSTILSAPKTLPKPAPGWGLMVPLYGLRGESYKSIGDYQDLAELASTMAHVGVGFVGINPVHAGFTMAPSAYSPYSPSSRQWLNPLHISVQHLPQWSGISHQFPHAGECGEYIDYGLAIAEKTKIFKASFALFHAAPAVPDFEAFVDEESKPLIDFATHQALSEIHGPYWSDWPLVYQHPNNPEIRQFAEDNQTAIQFHCWLQWVARAQLNLAQSQALNAGMAYGLYLDLAVGTHPFGAETWADQTAFSSGVSIGSPSDGFSANGQNWGLVPFNPQEMISRQYQPLVQTLRAQLQFSGLLRIDHILGFERSFWIPDGLPGAYVTFPRDALMAVARIEATRANALIVGEDLGNVPDGLRNALAQSGILGCRVAFFERNWKTDKAFIDAADYTPLALASITTHDLPTLVGWWSGIDINWRLELEEITEEQAGVEIAQRTEDRNNFAKLVGFSNPTPLSRELSPHNKRDLILSAYTFLAETQSLLLAVQIEDVLALSEQPNLPGTVSDHPNWRRRLPQSTSEIAGLPMLKEISRIMQAANRSAAGLE